jgi:hypothetical protein
LAILTVSNTNDSGVGSLRAAVEAANLNANLDTIVFAAAMAGQTITLTSGELALTNDVIIKGDVNGDNKADITISGGGTQRIFNQSGTGTDVDLLSLTLTDGHVGYAYGGAIRAVGGTLDIRNTTIQNSSAFATISDYTGESFVGIGGGLAAKDTAVLVDHSLLTGNSASSGGGLHIAGGSLRMENSTVYGNAASYNGGGVDIDRSTVTLVNSTITHNTANSDGIDGGSGAGLFIDVYATDRAEVSNVSVNNCIISNNKLAVIYDGNNFPIINNTFGKIITAANNVFGSGVGPIVNSINSLTDVNTPGLLALADNGGTVKTQNIAADSLVLINTGNNAAAAGLVTDGNGFNRVIGQTVDIPPR